MDLFFWQYDLPVGFAFDCVRYTVTISEGALHWHNYYQLALCTRGSGTFVFAEKAYPYTAGDLFVVDNTEQHGAFADSGGSADFLFVMFYPQFVARGTEEAFDYEYLLPFAYNPAEFCNKIPGGSALGQALKMSLLDLETENKARRRGYQHIISAKLRVILAELLGHYGIGEAERSVVDRHRKLRPAILYMEQHCHEPLTLEQVAQVVYLSPSRLRHLFQDTMHVGFKEYLIGLRYQMAKRMLSATNTPVSEIASVCGFSNLYSFYKLFRAQEGMTPAAYRSALRGKG